MKKKVSVIVPVYNAARYLKRCMKSLLEQSYENIEILLMDDGSTDESGKLCDVFASEHRQVKVIHKPNAGVSAARNDGIEQCSGEYLTFVDADDVLAADMIAYLVELLEQTDSDVSGCDYWEFRGDADGQRSRSEEELLREKSKDLKVLTGMEFIEKGILHSDTRCWSKLYKRARIGTLRFQAGLTIGEDMLFLLELAKAGCCFCTSHYKGYGYFINEAGAMMRSFKDSYMDQITCWQKAYAIIAKEAPQLADRTETILLTSIMLTVGKLAMLPVRERKEKKVFVRTCSKLIKFHGQNRRAYHGLEKGYQIKVTLYRWAPQIYMSLYGRLYRLKKH